MDSNSPHIEVVAGPDKGSKFYIPPAGARLGRSSKNDIALKDERLSRMHSEFYFRENQLFIRDKDSANKTLVNNEPAHDSALKRGDIIHMGETRMRILRDTSKARIKIKSGAGASAPAAQRLRAKSFQIPLFLRIIALPLWLLMIVWFVFLAYSMIVEDSGQQPYETAFDAEADASGPSSASWKDSAPLARSSSPQSPGHSDFASHQSQGGFSQPGFPEAKAPVGQRVPIEELKRNTVFKMVKREYAPAQESLLGALETPAMKPFAGQISEMAKMVKAVSSVPEEMSRILNGRLGETITLQVEGRPLEIRIQAITEELVRGQVTRETGDQTVNFRISKIPVQDQIAILGKPATTEQRLVMCILLVRAGRYAEASEYAADCGVLSETLQEILATLAPPS